MASFFSKTPTTKTVVKPDPAVAKMLQGILQDARGIDDFKFISHDAATMNPAERQQVQNYAQSGNLRAIGGALSPRLMQGIEQATQLNKTYENAATNNITANDVLKNSQALRNGVYQAVQNTAASAGNVTGRLGSAASRAAARRGTQQMQARNALDPSFNQRAINMGVQNQGNTLDVANMQAGIAGKNQQLGLQGVSAQNQATQNQLAAGNLLQNYDNALFYNQQQNQQGANDFAFNKLNNKMSILGSVSPMAGYTMKQTGAAAPSVGQQILGAGIAGAGAYLQNKAVQDYKTPMANMNQEQTNQAYNSALDFGGVDTPSNYQGNMAAVNNAARNINNNNANSGFWSNAWTGAKGALSSMVG